MAYSEGSLMQTALADVADKTSMGMLFGLYFTMGSAIGAPWAFLIGALVDGYGLAAAFAAMAVSQVLAALVLIPVRWRRRSAPSPITRNPATSLSDGGVRPHGQVVDGHYRP
jgi:sugar phosphate permease